MKSGEVETQVELSRVRPSVTPLDLRAMAELQVYGKHKLSREARPEDEDLMGPAKAGPRT